MYDPDQDRDYTEENYWRNYCPECDGQCVSENGHAELFEPHTGHFSHISGTWWCDTCNSPYCNLA